MRKVIIFILAFFFISGIGAASLDSLRQAFQKNRKDPELANKLARKFLESGQADSTLHYAHIALELAQSRDNHLQAGNAWYNISDFYYFQDSFRLVFSYGRKALRQYQKAKEQDEIAKVYNDFGLINMQLGELDSALFYFRKTLPLVKETGHAEGIFAVMSGLAQVHLKKGNYTDAILQYRRILEMADSVELPPNFISSAHTNLGVAMKKNGNLKMALDHYFTALKIDTTAGLEMDAAIDLSNIGGVLFALERYDEALEYFDRAYQKMEAHDMTSQMEVTLGNIASVYKSRGELEKALAYHQQALELAKMLDKKISIGIKYLNIGNIYTLMEEPDNALSYFDKALTLFRSSGSKYEIANTYLHISKANNQKKQYRQAREHGELAYQKADSINAVVLLRDAAELLSEVYYSLGNLDKALDYRLRYDAYKDSLYTQETNKLLAEMDARFNLSEQAHKINLLRKEQLLKNRTLRQQRQTIILLVSSGIILLIMIMLIWIQYRQKQRSYKNLVRKNRELIKAERAARKQELEKLETKSEQVITGEENILAGLYKLLDEQKIYLKPQISQKEVAEILETNTSYLSRVINKNFNLNFNNLINKYRVEEVQRLLSTENARVLTIEAIAKESGFHSKSAFQSAFKKFTGMTPSAYLREVRRNDNNQMQD